jgi:hypothetical protein
MPHLVSLHEAQKLAKWWIERDVRRHSVPSLEAVFIISCVNCHRVFSLAHSEPPECWRFRCPRCHYDRYECFVLRALRLTPLPDKKRLQEFHLREAGRDDY